MIFELPIRNDIPAYSYSIELDEKIYNLEFYFNYRMSRWFMTIKDSDNNILLSGINLISNWPLRKRFVNIKLPQHEFMIINIIDDSSPDRKKFGTNTKLIYTDEI